MSEFPVWFSSIYHRRPHLHFVPDWATDIIAPSMWKYFLVQRGSAGPWRAELCAGWSCADRPGSENLNHCHITPYYSNTFLLHLLCKALYSTRHHSPNHTHWWLAGCHLLISNHHSHTCAHTDGALSVQFFAQGHSDIQTAGPGDWNADRLMILPFDKKLLERLLISGMCWSNMSFSVLLLLR